MGTRIGGAGVDNFNAETLGETDESNNYQGLGGDDVLIGGNLRDSLTGGDGNDLIIGDDGADLIMDYSGENVIDGGTGDDNITDAGPGSSLNGGAGDDYVYAYGGAGRIFGDVGDDYIYESGDSGLQTQIDGYQGDDIIYTFSGASKTLGGAGDDYIYFNDGVFEIDGGTGDDVFQGSTNPDNARTATAKAPGDQAVIFGRAGDDFLFASEGTDRFDGGAGEDTVSYEYMSAGVTVNLTTGVAAGAAAGDVWIAVEDVIGTEYADRISGDGRINTFVGGEGDDVILGGEGGDVLDGGTGIDGIDYAGSDLGVAVDLFFNTAKNGDAQGDTISGFENLFGSELRDVLNGTNDGNIISGREGDDNLAGRFGADTMNGGEGLDRLLGGRDADRLTGGLGADTFAYTALTDSTQGAAGRDTIFDFATAQGDKIDVSGLDANTLVAGNQAFAFIGTGAFTGVAGQLRAVAVGANVVVSADVNGDSVSDFGILLSTLASVAATDFIL